MDQNSAEYLICLLVLSMAEFKIMSDDTIYECGACLVPIRPKVMRFNNDTSNSTPYLKRNWRRIR